MKRVLTTLLKSVCIIALVLCGMDAQAQGNLVTGAVRDAKGEPVIGATVIVKGTATGATSGADGRYSIQAGPDATLEFSFIGYKKQEVPVGTRSAIDVVLEEDALMVDDVVVIGYGTQSRRTITAAVSKVDGEKLAGAPVNSIGDALKGRVGGVRVSSADNQPGSDPVFLIRGGSSINQSNAPIIIIDGVNREMTGLNPNDIESIEVLKDAASAGIYGARASNGVILITTKKGKKDKIRISYKGNVGIASRAIPRYDLVDMKDYVEMSYEALRNSAQYGTGMDFEGASRYAAANLGQQIGGLKNPEYYNPYKNYTWETLIDQSTGKIRSDAKAAWNENWLDEISDNSAIRTEHIVSVNGGSERANYVASLGYYMEDGILQNLSLIHI